MKVIDSEPLPAGGWRLLHMDAFAIDLDRDAICRRFAAAIFFPNHQFPNHAVGDMDHAIGVFDPAFRGIAPQWQVDRIAGLSAGREKAPGMPIGQLARPGQPLLWPE